MWQKCPICNGIPNLLQVCSVCNGKKIISILNGTPPGNKKKEPERKDIPVDREKEDRWKKMVDDLKRKTEPRDILRPDLLQQQRINDLTGKPMFRPNPDSSGNVPYRPESSSSFNYIITPDEIAKLKHRGLMTETIFGPSKDNPPKDDKQLTPEELLILFTIAE